MTRVIGVRFRPAGKIYFFAPGKLKIKTGDKVIVETARGVEFGSVVTGPKEVEDKQITQPLKQVIRIATQEDKQKENKNREKEKEAFGICLEKIRKHGLEMKLIDAEYTFDNNKVLFYFTADGRIDFRELVKDLASVFRTRIELRQIGVRDEAKMLGGLGICGRPFCCGSFLDEFQPVSIKMAKTQSLSLNPTKISGTCGRLMCCLKYEQEAYEDLVKHAPKMDSFVETPDGVGTVSSVNLLRQQVQVRLDDTPETPQSYHNCEINVVRSGKGKRPEGYVPPSREELEKRRKPPEPEAAVESPTSSNPLAAALEAVFQGNVPPQYGVQAETQEERPQNRRRRRPGGPRPNPKYQEPDAPHNSSYRHQNRRKRRSPRKDGQGE